MIRFTKPRPVIKAKPKPKGGKKATLNKLNSFLKQEEPKTVEILVTNLHAQGNSVTYKELREAYLAGGLTEKQFTTWQKKYSKLVEDALKPEWEKAAALAAQEAKDKYPYFLYEPGVGAAADWIKQHGAELVTNLAQEQKDALNAMIQHCSGYTAITPDEAARIMRPCIGLTKPQALANARYREAVKAAYLKEHPHGKPETAEKKAAEAAARYAGRQHRYRAQCIARTELAYGYNAGAYGATKDAQAQGYIGDCMKVWLTAFDERVCPICSLMDEEKRNMDEPFSNGKMLPPGHPQCRCAVAYEEIENTNLTPATPDGTMDAQAQNGAAATPAQTAPPTTTPSPDTAQIPPDVVHNDLDMEYVSDINLGGTGKMELYRDADGNEWLFKPAQSKAGTPEQFRAYAQEAGYKVQGIVDPDTMVEVGVGSLDGDFGAYQRRIQTVNGTNFKAWQHGIGTLTPEEVESLQREHVTDWLLGNFDSHGGNFVTDASGRVIGIDKEQAFKYLKDKGSHKMSYSYHPNAKYGETEPVYNTLYRKFAKGEIDLDPQATLKYIQRVESIPDAEYREIFRNYAEGVCGKGNAAEQMLDAIVQRKQTLRQTYTDFYGELLTERQHSANPVLFQWADDAASAAVPKNPTVATIPGGKPKTPKKPKTTATKPTAPKTTPTAGSAQATESGYRISDVLDDMSVLPNTEHGVAIRSDSTMVEGLNLSGRRAHINGSDYYEITGKLTEETWEAAAKNAKARGLSQDMEYLLRDADGNYQFGNTAFTIKGNKIMTASQSSFEVYSDYAHKQHYGMSGSFRVRVPVTGNPKKDRKAMEEIFDKAGLSSLTANPTDADELLLRKSRIAWQRNPSAMEKVSKMPIGSKQRQAEIDRICKTAGFDDARIMGLKLKEVAPGYCTYIDEAATAEFRKAGLTHVWAGVGNPDFVVEITQNGGFMATANRATSGLQEIGKKGASELADMGTGGACSVFTRIGVNTNMEYRKNYKGGTYRILIDPEEMSRTDWYAYQDDSFGTVKDSRTFYGRPSPTDFIEQNARRYERDNEIMFRNGIKSDSFIGISCQTDSDRNTLLQAYKNAGVTQINGVDIEDFIQTTQEIGQDSKRGIMGLSYYEDDIPF